VKGDAVAFAAQRLATLVDARGPAAFGECNRRDEAAEAGADDFGVTGFSLSRAPMMPIDGDREIEPQHRYFQSILLAMSAPCRIALNFSHTTVS